MTVLCLVLLSTNNNSGTALADKHWNDTHWPLVAGFSLLRLATLGPMATCCRRGH